MNRENMFTRPFMKKLNTAVCLAAFVIPLLLFAMFFAGCASPTLTPIPSTGQTVEYHNGQPTIISQKTNTVIAGLITNQVDDHAILYIGALNKSADTATLGTENVSAILRTTTVHPGQFAGGVVEINNSGMRDTVNVHVHFADEMHHFAFRLKR
jgi:hypothetical protein